MKKLTKKVLPVLLAGIMVVAMAVPSMAAESATPATKALTSLGKATTIEYTFDDETTSVDRYTTYYLDLNKSNMPTDQYANAKVNIYVPKNAAVNTPVIYMVDNSGWRSDTYSDTLIVADGTEIKSMRGSTISEGYSSKGTSQSDLAAMALDKGYIVVNAGLRARIDADTNSPVTVADAKAVIMYVRSLGLGETMWISGTSGGGALSVAVASSGNSTDYNAELLKIGAAGVTKNADGTITCAYKNDVQGTIAYCPITDLGHADGSYEYTYAAARKMLLADGFTANNEDTTWILSDTTMTVSPQLAKDWVEYVNGLGVAGTDNAFTEVKDDAGNVISYVGSGTVYKEMKSMLIASLNEGLAAAGSKEAFEKSLAERAYATTKGFMGGYYVASETSPKTAAVDFLVYGEDGKISDIDMEKYAYYVAAGQALKNAPAFTNMGLPEAAMNENDLFGCLEDAYGYVSETVWDLEGTDGTLHKKYGDWDAYQKAVAEDGTSLALQVKMVDSIAYLVEGTSDIADNWYVRHGSLDRDTGFANQALLSLAMKARLGSGIADINYKFAYGKGHAGNYDNAEAFAYLTAKAPAVTVEVPATPTAPKTGDVNTLPLFAVVLAAGAVALVSTRKRVIH